MRQYYFVTQDLWQYKSKTNMKIFYISQKVYQVGKIGLVFEVVLHYKYKRINPRDTCIEIGDSHLNNSLSFLKIG